MNNDNISDMTTENLNSNTPDSHEELLERAVEMIEEGHLLTDDEMALLTSDKDAATAYRQLTALRDVVATPHPLKASLCPSKRRSEATPQSEQAEESLSPRTSHPAPRTSHFSLLTSHFSQRPVWLLAAAAVLLALILTYPLTSHLSPRTSHLSPLTSHLSSRTSQPSPVLVYEHTQKPDGIILKTNKGKTIDIATPKARTHLAQLKDDEGQLVLDYQTLLGQGYSLDTEVETNTVEIPVGKDFKLVLADGTQVWLYADSRLIYPTHFVGEERRVFLVGEAYFSVTKDSRHPFVVSTDAIEARVLGTELNVSCRGDNSHVALITGSVEVSTKSSQKRILTPGMGATLNGGCLTVAPEDTQPYVYWRNGYVFFDNAPLIEVAQSLGRWFNVNVALANEQTGNIRLHFMYKRSDSLRRVLSILNSFHKFHAFVKDNTLVIEE